MVVGLGTNAGTYSLDEVLYSLWLAYGNCCFVGAWQCLACWLAFLGPRYFLFPIELLLRKQRLVDRFLPSTYFPRVRALIENTTLYKVLRQMPKGGALHLHVSASFSMTWVVNQGADDPPLGSLAFYNATQAPRACRCRARRSEGDGIQKDKDFPQKLLKLLTVHEEDESLTSAEIWKKFADIFIRVAGFFTYREALEGYFWATMLEFLEDGVTHLEFRVDLFHDQGFLFDLDGREYRGAAALDVYQKQIQKMQVRHPELTVKLIGTSIRMRSPQVIAEDLAFALEVKAQRPDLLVGWDAPGEEDAGHPTLDYARQLLELKKQAKAGLELPLMLHDGEATLGGWVREDGVAIEVCPISNQVLRYLSDLRIHPGLQMLKMGLPVTISSDDPGIWGARGLSHDFWEVAVAWQLNTRALKTLARNSRLGLKGISELLLNRTFKATELEIFPGHFVTKR
ncbi:Adenosine deaminase 2 (Cat eye syndrome critical region protein 1) [Durusdinium trenchii]|uniref:Adenosine deaminase 2 (Cat eye syndrome critical region protein 1) n=1 Tax=Durusdinium trenchii TaxID=1381693 RepID=A0ABP0PMA2_9DINO